jgi:hypothetical protein
LATFQTPESTSAAWFLLYFSCPWYSLSCFTNLDFFYPCLNVHVYLCLDTCIPISYLWYTTCL